MITLNFITQKGKKRLLGNRLFILLKDISLSLLMISAVVGMTMVASQQILAQDFIQITKNTLSIINTEGIETQKIKTINNDLKKINSIQTQYVNWVEWLTNLNNLIYSNKIQIGRLNIDLEGQKVSLNGKAASREDFLDMKTKLEESEMFEEVISPLSNILSANKINFDLEMTLKKTEE